jgi:hypothetical protein
MVILSLLGLNKVPQEEIKIETKSSLERLTKIFIYAFLLTFSKKVNGHKKLIKKPSENKNGQLQVPDPL